MAFAHSVKQHIHVQTDGQTDGQTDRRTFTKYVIPLAHAGYIFAVMWLVTDYMHIKVYELVLFISTTCTVS